MAKYNRKKFFDGFRERLDPTISQEQVEGIEFLLKSFEQDPLWTDIRHIAYAFSTTFHETAGSMQPVDEGYYLGRARAARHQKTLRYYPYYGRGYVQLTWKTNYDRAGKAFGIDLVNKPERAMDKDVAYKVLSHGMQKAWFTKYRLSDFINSQETDYVNARKIINGMDKAGLIAGYAKSFEKILRASLSGEDSKPTANVVTPLVADPPISTDEPAVTSPDQPQEVITQNADTIINEESLVDKASKAGDKLQSVQGVLDKFGFSVTDAKRSIGTVVLTGAKGVGAVGMTILGVVTEHWELFIIVALLLVLTYLVWDRSGKRVAEAKAGVPPELAEKMIEQK